MYTTQGYEALFSMFYDWLIGIRRYPLKISNTIVIDVYLKSDI